MRAPELADPRGAALPQSRSSTPNPKSRPRLLDAATYNTNGKPIRITTVLSRRAHADWQTEKAVVARSA